MTPPSPTSISGQSTASTEATRYWNRILAPYARAHNGKALFQVLVTVGLFVPLWILMYWSLDVSYWLTLALAIPQSCVLIRGCIFQHGCGHGSFFRSPRWNNRLGSVLGLLSLMPYSYWRRTHAIHHATSGDLDNREFGDVVTLTVAEYEALTPWGRVRYRAYRNLITLLVLGPIYQFVIKHRFPFDIPKRWKKEWASVMWTNAGLAAIVVLAWLTIGIKAFLMVQLPINLLGGAIGIWLFYVQHQFEDTYWREHPEWDIHRAGIEGSSFYDLGAFLHWCTGNIGFHHIHHLASRIPNYNLKKTFRAIPELRHVTRLTLWSSFKCARLHLWDPQSQRLISFRQLRAAP
jgi:omega-6 fatty acid desaturase (delta-12 desaturase)